MFTFIFILYFIIRMFILLKKTPKDCKIGLKSIYILSYGLPLLFWSVFFIDLTLAFIAAIILFITYISMLGNKKVLYLNIINISELFLFGIPSIFASFGGLFTVNNGDTLKFLFWTIC